MGIRMSNNLLIESLVNEFDAIVEQFVCSLRDTRQTRSVPLEALVLYGTDACMDGYLVDNIEKLTNLKS